MSWQLLDDAVASALCPMFKTVAQTSSVVSVLGLAAGPKGWAVSATAAQVGALSMLGASATCDEVTIGPDPTPDYPDCWEVENGTGTLMIRSRTNGNEVLGYSQRVKKILSVEPKELSEGSGPYSSSECHFIDENDRVRFAASGGFQYYDAEWFIRPQDGATCKERGPEPTWPQPQVPDHTYTDPETNCNYTVKFEGFIRETSDGPILPVFQISGSQTLRAGGVMGGCNLSPVIHVSPPNGPGGPGGPRIPPIPVPPNPPDPIDGIPWWAAPLLGAATGALLNQIAESIRDLSKPSFNEGSFTLTAPCDVDENGDALTRTWEFEEGTFEERMNAHQVALMEILQQHLNWKTPTCDSREKPTLDGDWISTRWVSDSPSAGSRQYLRKLFRYRSKSNRTNDELKAYWSTFTWQAGSVIVVHKGAWWGTPKVWASSESEGKRVIRFAAGEAGIDPDQVGEWLTTSSDSSRYGMSGRMRLMEQQGEQWVTRREGASGLPEL